MQRYDNFFNLHAKPKLLNLML